MSRVARVHWPRLLPFALEFAALAIALVVGAAGAADLSVGSSVTPAYVHIGETANLSAFVELPPGALMQPKWLPPDSSAVLTWGPLRPSRHPTRSGHGDTLFIEASVQAFQLGNIVIPGMAFIDAAKPGSPPMRLPAVRLTVLPVIPASDSAADLKPVRGPLKAPWWELVPWGWVIAIGLLAGALAWWVMWLRRRPVATVTAMVPFRDPGEVALTRLAELRARGLPEAGQFGTHAFELTGILRRFLEATTVQLRPGFTTSHLSRRLEEESVPAGEAMVLVSLLRVWDRVKFARAPFTPDEARKSEDAVEQFVRRRRPPAGKGSA